MGDSGRASWRRSCSGASSSTYERGRVPLSRIDAARMAGHRAGRRGRGRPRPARAADAPGDAHARGADLRRHPARRLRPLVQRASPRRPGDACCRFRGRCSSDVQADKPEIYYRIVARVARRISDRLRAASELLAEQAAAAPEITSYRTEHDSLGEREIPNNAYYGVQTVRALENFAISGMPLRNFAHFVRALAYVKKAAAQANAELEVPRRRQIADAIAEGVRRNSRRQAARSVRRRHDPGRRRHLDEHERQRGDRQPRPRTDGPRQGRIPAPAPERPRQLLAVHQRRLSHGDQARR